MAQQATDETLIADFAAGRRAALGDLARRYEAPLLGLAQGLLGGDAALAQDAVQETWVRVIRFAGQFNGRSSAKTWLYRIAINQCRNLRAASPAARGEVIASTLTAAAERRRDADGSAGLEGLAVTAGVRNATRVAPTNDPTNAPDARAMDGERRSALFAALDQLDEAQRQIILLCYHAGMTHPVAAEILDIPVGTLKSRLSAALGELRRMLAEESKA